MFGKTEKKHTFCSIHNQNNRIEKERKKSKNINGCQSLWLSLYTQVSLFLCVDYTVIVPFNTYVKRTYYDHHQHQLQHHIIRRFGFFHFTSPLFTIFSYFVFLYNFLAFHQIFTIVEHHLAGIFRFHFKWAKKKKLIPKYRPNNDKQIELFLKLCILRKKIF